MGEWTVVVTLPVHSSSFCSSFAGEARSLKDMRRGRSMVQMTEPHYSSPRALSIICKNPIQIMSLRAVAITQCHLLSPPEISPTTENDTKTTTCIILKILKMKTITAIKAIKSEVIKFTKDEKSKRNRIIIMCKYCCMMRRMRIICSRTCLILEALPR